ncbi:SH3 domain-containing protein [Salinarimonas ramus]|uniref:SH3b domain-containing protein n=1 Tax=Salinarimonas ramus TaxID=690164 RepID=A0A917V3I8_9HYPH|nr:I78 family peptidase inhibitor [Salinarimonas ramus]GGK32005.1 hypothetical protein GCM10011322_18310 [Salinarimonas ramus]
MVIEAVLRGLARARPVLAGALALAALGAVSGAQAEPARTTADLNLRQGPGTQYAIVASMPRGSLVDVRDCVRSWCEVGYRGRIGWASRRFLALGAVPGPIAPRPIAPGPVIPGPVVPGPVRPVPEAAPPFPFPFIGDGPRRPARAECRERPVFWLVGERATERRLQEALNASGARTLRVEEPGRFYTQEYRPDRLSVRVDVRNVVVDVACR